MNVRGISRVVVWLDPNAPQEASLPALAGLGAAAEFMGLFVEDADLLSLSRLSVAREITYEGAASRQLEQSRTEQEYRVHAARMRSGFEAAARELRARHSFRIARGALRAELLKAAEDCDALVLTHSPGDYHPDHQATSSVVEAASWFCASAGHETESEPLAKSPTLWWMDTVDMIGFEPHFYVNISDYIDLKLQMMRCHKSQLARSDNRDFAPLEEMMLRQCQARGAHVGVAAAEAFRQHEAWKRMSAW